MSAREMLKLIAGAAMALAVASASAAEVRMHVSSSKAGGARKSSTAVMWLKPVGQTPAAPFTPEHHYTLIQKNRMFTPHLLVIPVGSVVAFPNADPFFHNVFSLFDGKRFDLGLYEAGSSKAVTFSREGVSYIFCNIHPQMSAVILTLSTSLYDVADSSGAFRLADVPEGDYEVHVWAEGVSQADLDRLTRRVHIASGLADLGSMQLPPTLSKDHTNMFGQPYDVETKPTY